VTKPIQARTRSRRRNRIISPVRRRFGLRTRLTFTFALGAAVLSASLAFITYGLTRQNLIDQRENSAVSRSIQNADQLTTELPFATTPSDITHDLDSLPTPNDAESLLHYQGQWYSTDPLSFSERLVPVNLRILVSGGQPARMRTEFLDSLQLVVGVPLTGLGGEYYETVPMNDLERTLSGLAYTLLGASLLTTLGGVLIGYWASRRIFAPLLDVGTAAHSIAGGRLDTRLPVGADPDLDLIAIPFNEMAQALEDRIERDARFASEVSHELRSPLMTLAASVEVLENQQDEMTERAQTALGLLSADIGRLQQLVEDLLEISRFDVGAITLHLEDVVAVEMVIQAVSILGGGGVAVKFEPAVGELIVRVDKRRFGRVIANLLDNASRYAGGATAVIIARQGDMVQIAIEDRGNGVPEEERDIIFDRFSRGGEGGNRSTDRGVGLGLALVDEHVRLHGGRVWVEDRIDGDQGARFMVELPIVNPPPIATDIEEPAR